MKVDTANHLNKDDVLEIIPKNGDNADTMKDWRLRTYYIYGNVVIARSENCKVVVYERPSGWHWLAGLLDGNRAFEMGSSEDGMEGMMQGLSALDKLEKDKPWDSIQVLALPTHHDGRPVSAFEVGFVECRPDTWVTHRIGSRPPYVQLG